MQIIVCSQCFHSQRTGNSHFAIDIKTDSVIIIGRNSRSYDLEITVFAAEEVLGSVGTGDNIIGYRVITGRFNLTVGIVDLSIAIEVDIVSTLIMKRGSQIHRTAVGVSDIAHTGMGQRIHADCNIAIEYLLVGTADIQDIIIAADDILFT